jgi:uncharacterized protein YjbI with pentapeptide repeats
MNEFKLLRSLERKDFQGLDFRNLILSGMDLTDCDFSGSNMCGANFSCCLLNGCDFSNCEMIGTNISNSKSVKAIFRNVCLKDSVLVGSNLRECFLRIVICLIVISLLLIFPKQVL